MAVVINPRMNPWKDASRFVGGADLSVMAYVKCIADVGLAAGSQADQATVAVVGDVVTFQIAADAGALANDTGIDYTGAAGADGTITITDGNANSVREFINIVNGVGTGQTAFRRWRASLGDFFPGRALTGGDFLARAATNALLGRYDAGLALFGDTSALAQAGTLAIGIGTDRGTIEGGGASFPDYFEDIPGSSTIASVNTPLRSSATNPRKRQDAVTARRQYRVTGYAISAVITTSTEITIRDIDDNVLYRTPFASGAALAFVDLSNHPIEGPVGSPLFVEATGTTLTTDGAFFVRAEERFV